MAVLGLHFCARAFSSCGKRGPLFIAVRGPLTIAASLVAEHRLQTRRLSNCGSRAQLLRGMWDLPRPGREPMSPALAGRLSTTAPPEKPCLKLFNDCPAYRMNSKLPRFEFRVLYHGWGAGGKRKVYKAVNKTICNSIVCVLGGVGYKTVFQYLPCTKHLMYSHHINPIMQVCYYLHFRDKETEGIELVSDRVQT